MGNKTKAWKCPNGKCTDVKVVCTNGQTCKVSGNMKETKFDQKAFDAGKAKLDEAMAKLKKKMSKIFN